MQGFVFSSSTNAYTVYVAAKQLGVRVFTSHELPIFPIPYKANDEKNNWLFFTEEASLRKALEGGFKGKYLPQKFPHNLLDDKWNFAEWLNSKTALPNAVPHWSMDSIDELSFPCVVKAKNSWKGNTKAPRGWLCDTQYDIEKAVQNIEENTLSTEDFFFQKWLDTREWNIIATCGFHDSADNTRNLYAFAKRISSSNAELSCAAIVETVNDNWDLTNKTKSILNELEFSGPFELEFLILDRTVFVLELNPRFWLQHAIFLFTGNGLMLRYLGLDSERNEVFHSAAPVVWIDGVHIMKSIALFRLNFLWLVLRRYSLSKKQLIIWPSLTLAFFILSKKLARKIFGVFSR